MCAQPQSSPRDNQSDETTLCPKAQTLLAYLDETVDSESYLKSRFIARDIDLSAKEIGAMMPKRQDESGGLTIEKWGYTNGTTWRVRPE
jgi:hypothetical protein